MNLDEQLPTLLAQEAEHADTAPPTLAGVQTFVSRRARRRHRQRMAGGVLAGLCVVAGAVGGFALSGNDSEPVDIVPAGGLPAVPSLGIEADGLTLSSATEVGGPPDASSEPAVVYFTRATESPLGPLIVAYLDSEPSVQPSIPTATPVDLDGDGATGGPGDGRVGSLGRGEYVTWTTGDGHPAAVGGYGVDQTEIVDYVRSLGPQSYSLETVPAPDGFPERRVIDPGSDPTSTEFLAIYTSDNGRTIFVSTTNAPGRFDARRVNADAQVEVPLGTSILGDGVAVLSEPGSAAVLALVRTDSGLTVEISGDGLDADEVRDLLADGRFVEVEPTNDPAESVPPSPTTSVTTPPTDDADRPAVTEDGCEAEPGSATDLSEEPRGYLGYGEYDRWRDEAGCPVRIDVISSIHLAAHCGWEAARSITIGRPLGTPIGGQFSPTTAARYLWNADGVVTNLAPGATIRADELPATAVDTGYRLGSQEMWLDPADEGSLYVVDGDQALVFVDAGLRGICA